MKRDPLAIIHRIADDLSHLEVGTRLNPNQLARRVGVSWETAVKYAQIISLIQCETPRIELSSDNRIVVSENPHLAAQDTDEGLLQRLFYAKAFTQESAIQIDRTPVMDILSQAGLIHRDGKMTWLSLEGLPKAFSAADELDSRMHKAFAKIGSSRWTEEMEAQPALAGIPLSSTEYRDRFSTDRTSPRFRTLEDPPPA